MDFYVAAKRCKPAKELVDCDSDIAAFQNLRERRLIRRANSRRIDLTELAGGKRIGQRHGKGRSERPPGFVR